MANPQREDGHIDIANEIAEVLMKTQLSGYESRILWALWRKTYGWHKKEDAISITQFERMTNIKRRHVQKTLQRLLDRSLVTKNGYGFITKWAFQKDYTKWKATITENGYKKTVTDFGKATITENGYKPITEIGADKRNYTKEKRTKENMIWSQIKNLLSQFPIKIQEMIEEYIEIARLENKTERITLQKRRRLINELHLLWTSCDHLTLQNDFEKALRITINNEAPNVNYVKKVMESIMRRRSTTLKKGKENKEIIKEAVNGHS